MNSLHNLLLATLREHVLMHIVGNPLFPSDQQQQATERVACCSNRHTLGRWIGEARQEAHNRRAAHAAAQEVQREFAAVVRYVRDENGVVALLPARQYPQPGQTIWLALNQN